MPNMGLNYTRIGHIMPKSSPILCKFNFFFLFKKKEILKENNKKAREKAPRGNLCGLEPQLIKLEFIIYLPKLKVSMGALL